MHIPEYSASLLLWILPIIAITIFFVRHRLLAPAKTFALVFTIIIMSSIGFVLDLLFAHCFFTFDNPKAVCGISICQIPIEDFVFYISGFWFILFIYVFCDEWFMLKYNPPDKKYARYSLSLRHKLILHIKSLWLMPACIIAGVICKRVMNPGGELLPGYYTFLVIAAYVPTFLFYTVTKPFVNWRAFFFSMIITLLISVVWEVTLAIPNGYWGYKNEAMLGIFIQHWDGLPIEAVTVWIFSSLIILVYEFIKICYFTPISSAPWHKWLRKKERKWRKCG